MTDFRVTNTESTYGMVGIREDLTDVIWRVSPVQTPFVTSIAKAKAYQTNHEWQRLSLAAAGVNAHQEGEDTATAGFDAADTPVRLGNRTQILSKSIIISGTAEAVLKAGRKSEMAYQVTNKGLEIRRDLELAALANHAKTTAAAGTAPRMAGFASWIVSNYSKASDGTLATGDGTDAYTPGTARTLTESLVKTMLQSCYNNSGDQPTMLITSVGHKPIVSSFSANSTRMVDADSKKLYAGIDWYYSDFQELKVTPDRHMPSGFMYAVNPDLWAMAYLRPLNIGDLGKSGDANKKLMLLESTLEARNEAGNGMVTDLS